MIGGVLSQKLSQDGGLSWARADGDRDPHQLERCHPISARVSAGPPGPDKTQIWTWFSWVSFFTVPSPKSSQYTQLRTCDAQQKEVNFNPTRSFSGPTGLRCQIIDVFDADASDLLIVARPGCRTS